MRRAPLLAAGLLVGAVLVLAVALPARGRSAPTVLLLGDSITYGQDGANELLPGGFRDPLHRLLGQAGVPHRFVGSRHDNATPALTRGGQDAHEGWPGYRIDQAAALLPDGSPDAVLVLLGTNDVAQRYDPAASFPTPDGRVDPGDPAQVAVFARDLAGRLAALLDRLAPAPVVVTAVPPHLRHPSDLAPDPLSAGYNQALRAVVAQQRARGRRVELADAWTPFLRDGLVDRDLLAADGTHPTRQGYQVLARVLAPALERALQRPPQ